MQFYKKKLFASYNYYSFLWRVTDAIRITLSIVFPVALLYAYGIPSAAMPIGIGSLLASLIDYSDVWKEKAKVFRILTVLFFLICLMVSEALLYPISIVTIIFLFSFGFSFFHVHSKRWAIAGSVCIVLMVFAIAFRPTNPVLFSALVTVGSLWYYLLSFIFYRLWPFRSANQAIIECMIEMGKFMYCRKKLYDPDIPLENAFRLVISGHETVNAKQEMLRSLILSDKVIVNQQSKSSKKLLPISIILIDLYEQIRAMPLDYGALRRNLRKDELSLVRNYIQITALRLIKLAITKFKMDANFSHPVFQTNSAIISQQTRQHASKQIGSKKEIFEGIIKNIDNISAQLETLQRLIYDRDGIPIAVIEPLKFAKFVEPPNRLTGQIRKHFTLNSDTFRFSLRMAVAMTTAYSISTIFSLGHYSYWIMLTIALVLRPDFVSTQRRSSARLTGTFTGVIVGILLTLVFNNFSFNICALCVCLTGYFYFLQISYATSVAFITTFVIIALSMGKSNQPMFVTERICDTLLGCGLSFLACFIFPAWEVNSLNKNLNELIKANLGFVESKLDKLKFRTPDFTHYKLSRRWFYINSAQFTEAANRISHGPGKNRVNLPAIERFVILNYLLYAAISSMDAGSFYNEGSYDSIIFAIENAVKVLRSESSPFKDFQRNFTHYGYNVPRTDTMIYNSQTCKTWHSDYIQRLAFDIIFQLNSITKNKG
ncbi:FUSC family membrane protein [Mucilaginibacter sp. SG564]|uniref:FUSC family protein n=1 Tax=Mucilaginibacter sp. SG564 TaxID=2587022 RepID=UPI001553D256|nr:FUSC family membrane protein [Mucilaginibacter sp. SG564]NOW96051.1 putative membrane protein YccC [Mucilaginibacter sp. SG564]